MQAALETVRTKIEIRQKFLSGALDAVETELRVLEAEAVQLKKVLTPKVELARKETQDIVTRVEWERRNASNWRQPRSGGSSMKPHSARRNSTSRSFGPRS